MTASERPDKRVADGAARSSAMPDWWIYKGSGRPLRDGLRLEDLLPDPPEWRRFGGEPFADDDIPPDDGESRRRLGARPVMPETVIDHDEVAMVNAALYLRRPLLVKGPPGAGKSTLAHLVATELKLGRVICWHITSTSTLKAGLYSFDTIGRAAAVAARQTAARLHSTEMPETDENIGDYVHLGPLGTAFLPSRRPRVLLIDEIDKSELDLPNDLLGIFESGSYTVPELERVAAATPDVSVFVDDPKRRVTISGGRVECHAFPFIVMTSNGERDFPPAFMRRCLQIEIKPPSVEKLAAMVAAHLKNEADAPWSELIQDFAARSGPAGEIPADRLLDALFLSTSGAYRPDAASWPRLRDALWRELRSV
ncbi:AAA family ATPase [Kibdelosporangium aridum]|uniref:ATPase family associated with various cellular activities (AAA) n=1 Tax=Kibdelosporangium aridum TaxID=2030 RepID=A0A1Y5YAN4_KIBAR|nr:MoxR family ATPase [Kibdelosporangium aridum]SMD27175.1 ATPase family associated with various cellular activities (AAA) [Kibdelosporangium aridum]